MTNSILLVFALSLDGFLAALAYGARKIKMSIPVAFLISGIGTLFLGISFFASTFITTWIPLWACSLVSFLIFFLLGLSALFKGAIKTFLKNRRNRKVSFACSGFSFVLDVYMDETKADADFSKDLSVKEAMYLAIALSIDSLASGVACAACAYHPVVLLFCSFFVGGFFLLSGTKLGNMYQNMERWNLSWISAIVFFFLAFMRVV